jgi:hypothetical protein
LAVDPDDERTVYAGNIVGSVFVSRDAGESWTQIASEVARDPERDPHTSPRAYDILVKPGGENAVYVATARGVYRMAIEGKAPATD